MEQRVLLHGPAATEALGELLGQRLLAGQGLALCGDLGAGKTCLARGVARGLGVDDPDEVCSPTYLLVIEHPGAVPMVHIDAYLGDKARAFLEDGGLDYLAERGGVVVVEWADRLADLLPESTLWVRLDRAESDEGEARVARLSEHAAFDWISALPVELR